MVLGECEASSTGWASGQLPIPSSRAEYGDMGQAVGEQGWDPRLQSGRCHPERGLSLKSIMG